MSDDFENRNNEYDVFSGGVNNESSPEEKKEAEGFEVPKTPESFASSEEKKDVYFSSSTPFEPQPQHSALNNAENNANASNNSAPQQNHNPYSTQNSQYGFGANNVNRPPYGQPQQNSQRPAQPQYRPYGYAGTTPPAPHQPKKKNGKKIAGIAVALVVIVAVAAIVASFFGRDKGINSPSTTNPSQGIEAPSSAVGESTTSPVEYSTSSEVKQLSAVEVAEKARKSVVGVMTYSAGKLSGEGSGVAMALDKTKKYTYILTCAHVISDKNITYRVETLEGKTYEATLVAYDTRTDIGVLKVEAIDIPLAELGDSTSLKVGETVYAIGNPGGSEYFGSMTDGIISAIDRSVSSTYTMTCIQHNAAINPGNSGGALVNSAGQVIGINSSKIAATDYEGMGFAVPIATAKSVAESLIEYGYVPNRPKLGIEYASVSSYQLYSMVVAIKGLPAGSLVIAGISTDSSLVNTKAQVGDLIIGVNGQKMNDSSVLLDLINTGAVGDTITLNLCRIESRTYKTTEFDVTLTLVEDKGNTTEETTQAANADGYYRGGASSFEDFFKQYFGY